MAKRIDIKKLEEAANRLRVLSHPMRIAIIDLLIKHKRMNVTEIYTKLELEQAPVSHHLSLLKHQGLVKSVKVGRRSYYSLRQKALEKIIECIKKCRK
jgi:DNA-binding transcriptional ArsR family regulator